MRHYNSPQDTISDYAASLAAAGRRAATIRQRTSFVRRWAAAVTPGGDIAESITDWIASHPAWSPQTRASAATSLRSWVGWAARHSDIPALPDIDLIPVPRVPAHSPRPLADDAIMVALDNCDELTATMILLGREAGLRRGEIAQVHSLDLLPGDRLLVHGKGGKDRVVPLAPDLAARLRRLPSGWAFPDRRDPTRPMTPRAVGDRVTRALPSGTPHQLRHSFATTAYSAGGRDVLAVQRLLGHASVATTQGYVAVADDTLADVVAASALPQQRGGR